MLVFLQLEGIPSDLPILANFQNNPKTLVFFSEMQVEYIPKKTPRISFFSFSFVRERERR
jgi:hypothetical protein